MALLILSNVLLEILDRIIRQEKETKASRFGGKRKETVFADGVRFYTENLRTLLKTIRMSKFGKCAGCSANVICVSTRWQEQPENEIKEVITTASRRSIKEHI